MPTSEITSPEYLEELMELALQEARTAYQAGEVPVGAVLAVNGEIIAKAHNEIESKHDATCHAERLVISKASEKLKDWRLADAVLCVTLEPCAMCIGAVKLARIPLLVYGAKDSKMGACGSLFDLSEDSRLGPVPRVISGIKEQVCAALLKDFFRDKRER